MTMDYSNDVSRVQQKQRRLQDVALGYAKTTVDLIKYIFEMTQNNKSNSTMSVVQVEANLQKLQLLDHLLFENKNLVKIPGP